MVAALLKLLTVLAAYLDVNVLVVYSPRVTQLDTIQIKLKKNGTIDQCEQLNQP